MGKNENSKGKKIAGTTIRLKTDAIIVAESDTTLDVHYWQNAKFSKVLTNEVHTSVVKPYSCDDSRRE